jgi:DNA-binding MarR family transcriptional regulator
MAKNPFLWWLPDGEAADKGKSQKAKAPPAAKGKAAKTVAAKPAAKAEGKKASPKKSAAKSAQAKPVAQPAKPATKPATKPAAKPASKPAPQPAMEIYDIHDKPGHLIRRAQQIAVALFLEHCGDFDLTPVQYGALNAVASNPGIDATRIAGIVALDRTTISGVLERLEAKGLIARTANDADRRAKLLEATAAGKKLIRKIEPAVEAAQEAILAPLNRQERNQLIALLTKLVDLNNDASRAPRRIGEDA